MLDDLQIFQQPALVDQVIGRSQTFHRQVVPFILTNGSALENARAKRHFRLP